MYIGQSALKIANLSNPSIIMKLPVSLNLEADSECFSRSKITDRSMKKMFESLLNV
jgi:hypothetical protein